MIIIIKVILTVSYILFPNVIRSLTSILFWSESCSTNSFNFVTYAFFRSRVFFACSLFLSRLFASKIILEKVCKILMEILRLNRKEKLINTFVEISLHSTFVFFFLNFFHFHQHYIGTEEQLQQLQHLSIVFLLKVNIFYFIFILFEE